MRGPCSVALRAFVLAVASGGAIASAGEPQAGAPVIAAAADLRFALDTIAGRFHEETGNGLRIRYGSSGELARQIEQGAPFELFLSADEAFVLQLADRGQTLGRGALYAIGRIALFAPKGSPMATDPGLQGLRAALAAGRIRKFAIANPEHAPYGRAAEEALRSQGLWDALQPFLVRGENASQATQFASSGSAQGGIVPYALAIAPAVRALGSFALLPADWHRPLRQRMVLLPGAGEATRAFYRYLQQPAARDILQRGGFLLPDEDP